MSPANKTRLIGIAGPSGAGKTRLALALGARLSAPVLPLDAYYRDLSALSPALREQHNFDHPDALDKTLLLAHLDALASGDPVERPVYDFVTHTRSDQTRRFEPAHHVIVEGLFTLHFEELRRRLDLSVYVDTDEATCLARRIARDTASRGRTEASVRRQARRTVVPMARRYVLPTRHQADLVVRGDRPLERAVGQILATLQRS